MSLLFLFFCYATNFATNIKTVQISELRECCRAYQNVANLAQFYLRKIDNGAKLRNATNFKPLQSLAYHQFKDGANLPFHS